jgi:hypothetical protein
MTILLNTPVAFRLLSLRAQLRLEAHGLKSSGGAIRPRIAKEFGLSPRASRDTYIIAINNKLQELK